MSKKKKSLDSINQNKAVQKLAADLIEYDSKTKSWADDEMLSIIIEEAYRGIDISTRYPTFYQKLLKNANLRQAFTDILESLEKEDKNKLIPLPKKPEIELDFLEKHPSKPVREIFDQDKWRINWLRTFEQLQEIFSPPKYVYRSDSDLIEDPWFTLLREEFEIGKSLYSITLDCTLSEKGDNALSPFLNLALTLGVAIDQPPFPIHARLRWGEYDEMINLTDEGRVRLPDIPINVAFDEEFNLLESELSFTLETIP